MNKGMWAVSLILSICVIFLSVFSLKLFEKINQISIQQPTAEQNPSATKSSTTNESNITQQTHYPCDDREDNIAIKACFAENEEAMELEVHKRYNEILEVVQKTAITMASQEDTGNAMASFYINLPEDLNELNSNFNNFVESKCQIQAGAMWGGTGTSSKYNTCKSEEYRRYLKDLDVINWYLEGI